MDILSLQHSPWFTWVILPVLIFLARISDVTIGTVRIIYVSRGHKYIAPILGGFEALIWLLAISQIFQHMTNIFCYIAYCTGYATGNFVGMWLEERLAMGVSMVRMVTGKNTSPFIERLRNAGYGVTCTEATGHAGNVRIVFSVIKRKDVTSVINMLKDFDPEAFYTIEEIRDVGSGRFPARSSSFTLFPWKQRDRTAA